LKTAKVKEGLLQTLLRHIFGILAVIRYPLRHGEHGLLVTQNQSLERLRISALCGSYQRLVGAFVYPRCAERFHESDPPPPLRHKVRETN
jgi:hypothetical protein